MNSAHRWKSAGAFVTATAAGFGLVLTLDATSRVAAGATPLLLLSAACLSALVGGLVGLLSWTGYCVARAGQERLVPRAPQHVLVIASCVVLMGWFLHPIYESLAMRPSFRTLSMAAPLGFGVAVWGFIRISTHARRPHLWGLAGLVPVVGLQVFNRWYLPMLYPRVHEAITVVALCCGAAAAALLTQRASRRRAVLLASWGVAGVLSMQVPSLAEQVRAPTYATEGALLHVFASWEARFDRDGDGFSPSMGDCDDSRVDVHPMQVEIAGNAVDDNCAGGDAPRVLAPRRAVHAPAHRDALLGWQNAHPSPNVLLVLVDTLRTDAVGAYGAARSSTPTIDALAAQSWVFEQARTAVPTTKPSLLSMFTARWGSRGLRCWRSLKDPGDSTLLHRLKGEGYSTQARMVSDNWGRGLFGDGFDEVSFEGGLFEVTGPRVTDDALAILGRITSPFLLLVHYIDPHAPYLPQPRHPAQSAAQRDLYRAEVAATDAQVGRLLQGLERAGHGDDTLVVVFGDHGENLGERGSRGGHHGATVYEEAVRVPLIMRVPNTGAGRVASPVSLIDVTPSMLELIGAPPLPNADGHSLVGHFFGTPPPPHWTLSEVYAHERALRGIVEGRYKLIHDVARGTERLFDLAQDPAEATDIARRQPERVRALRAHLDAWFDRVAPDGQTELCPR